MPLKCPYCGIIWQNRVAKPRVCTRCKRYFFWDIEGQYPEEVETKITQEWIQRRRFKVDVGSSTGIYPRCSVCEETAEVWIVCRNKTYCPKCFNELLAQIKEEY